MITIQTNTREATRDLNRLLFVTIPKATDDAIKKTVESIQAKMQEEGSPVTYPIHWDSPKQQRAYFATDGFGEGIPYRRKGEYQQAWKVREIAHGYELANRSGRALFIAGSASGEDISPGKKQSNIHKGRWKLFRPTVDTEVSKLPDELIKRITIEA